MTGIETPPTGQRFDAEEAKRIGLIEILTVEGAELSAARELAKKITANFTVAKQAVKAAVRSALDLSVMQGLAMESQLISLCFVKADLDRLRLKAE